MLLYNRTGTVSINKLSGTVVSFLINVLKFVVCFQFYTMTQGNGFGAERAQGAREVEESRLRLQEQASSYAEEKALMLSQQAQRLQSTLSRYQSEQK